VPTQSKPDRRAGGSASRQRGELRQKAIVVAAFEILTERGFEGLRIRDVATRVGINNATLHYYFPAKEDLIRAVFAYTSEAYLSDMAPKVEESDTTCEARRALRAEFRNSRHWRTTRPELLTVSREFALRALRHEDLRVMLEQRNRLWRGRIEAFLTKGVEDGVFRSDLDLPACETLLMSFLWGAAPFLDMNYSDFDRACAEFERLLLVNGINEFVSGPQSR
jgi:TetR/AcrR family transcriptional regulator, regulator of cefoperazone and chloramphenicol sensitivity